MLRYLSLLLVLFVFSSLQAQEAEQEQKRKFNFPYLSVGTSVIKPLKEVNLEVGVILPWNKNFTIWPSIGLNRISTGGLITREANIIYGAGYNFENYDYSIDYITRGILSLEIVYPLNDRFEIFGGYGLGLLFSSEGIVYIEEGYETQPIDNFEFTSTRITYKETFINKFTGLRRGQHFISIGGEYSLKDWLRLGSTIKNRIIRPN